MSPLAVVVLIVLVDLMGFSIVMPLLPRFADDYGFSKLQIGILMAAYPMLQLLAGPILGRLSDRIGRRPVLILSQAGTAISFVILALTRNYSIMLLARMLDGASGGNILVAQAYVADVTKPEHRARSLGLLGAAFGVGFVLGPLMGGLLLSPELPIAHEWRLKLPFLVAAAFSTIAWLLVLFRLPESIPAGSTARQAARVVSWEGLVRTLSRPKIRGLVAVSAISVLAFAALESTFSLFLKERLYCTARQASFAFAYLGIFSAIAQGGLIRPLVKRFGESKLVLAGLVIVGSGYICMALTYSLPMLLLAVPLIATGQGLAGPSLQGLISRLTPLDEQGAVFGTLNSAQTLARMTNYLIANMLMKSMGLSSPFFEAAILASTALMLAIATLQLTKTGEQEEPAQQGPADPSVARGVATAGDL